MNYVQAVVAQPVERRLGKAEVGGSIPLDSFLPPLDIKGVLFVSQAKHFPCYSCPESSTIVKGPSLTRLTFMSAPNFPVCTTGTDALHFSMIYS